MTNSTIYRVVEVLRRNPDESISRYRCLERLPEHDFCVVSCDFFELPVDGELRLALEKQFLELVLEERPEDRTEFHKTLEQAIRAHDEDFRTYER